MMMMMLLFRFGVLACGRHCISADIYVVINSNMGNANYVLMQWYLKHPVYPRLRTMPGLQIFRKLYPAD